MSIETEMGGVDLPISKFQSNLVVKNSIRRKIVRRIAAKTHRRLENGFRAGLFWCWARDARKSK